MSEHFSQTIADLQVDIARKEQELVEHKRMVNYLCGKIGQQAYYPDVDKDTQASLGSIRRDQWYGQPISTAIREYLAIRRAINQGPATVNEIFEALKAGGYAFGTDDDENAKRGLRISLTKNSQTFHRLPDGKTYGLLDWYPEAKNRKSRDDETDAELSDSLIPPSMRRVRPIEKPTSIEKEDKD